MSDSKEPAAGTATTPTHFIRNRIKSDLDEGKHNGAVRTRFPPQPNGFLHVGHVRSIWLNFSTAAENGGTCNLRFDDTNPLKEEQQYINAIKEDIEWLGYSWSKECYTSSYFEDFWALAVKLIEKGLAYVCDLSADEVKQTRGTLKEPGKESPYRGRSVQENLQLFEAMRRGDFPDGSKTLRAKIDMASGNINLRDPALYRIRHASHHQTGDLWCVYPMYDWAHGLSDAVEDITHSLCTLEFQDHRPLYEWLLEALDHPNRPQQIEFARLNLSYTVTSKRKLRMLVEKEKVRGWDDPRMPTVRGLRRRGVPAAALIAFCDRLGVSKKDTVIDYGILEDEIRSHLNEHASRRFCVENPLRVTITNWSEDEVQEIKAPLHPQDPSFGERTLKMARHLWIDADDFMEDAPKKFFRLAPGREVRLRYGYVIKCEEVVKDETGKVVELMCTCDKETLGAKPEGRKVKGVIHWLADCHKQKAQLRVYDRLFKQENPAAADSDEEFLAALNPDSLVENDQAFVEPLSGLGVGDAFQFERIGYFATDADSTADGPVFNRVVTLRDSWSQT